MKMTKAVNAVAVVFLFVFALGCAEPVTTEQRLAEIASKVEDIDSYKVTMTMDMEMMGQTMTTEQKITFKKPNKMRTTSTSDMMGGVMTQEMYSTGDIMWYYMPTMGMATKMDMSKFKGHNRDHPGMAAGGSMINMFENIPKDKIEYIEDKVTDEGLVYVFEANLEEMRSEAPESPMLAMFPNKMVFWMGADTGLPVKIIMVGKEGNTMMEQTYSDLEINPEIDDSIFEFTPPEGVQVMDMSERAKHTMKNMMGHPPKEEEDVGSAD